MPIFKIFAIKYFENGLITGKKKLITSDTKYNGNGDATILVNADGSSASNGNKTSALDLNANGDLWNTNGLAQSLMDSSMFLDDLKRDFGIDEESIQWIKNNPLSEEVPLMIVHFECIPCFLNEDAIFALLIQNRAVQKGSNMFQFNDWQELYDARRLLFQQYPALFYSTHPSFAQINAISHAPTIRTTFITDYCKKTKTLSTNPYLFFKII